LCLNGHEWAKRQARGLDFEPLDNGFRATDDADALAAICGSLTERDIERFFARWEARLPSPFSAQDGCAATATRSRCASWRSLTRASLTGRPRAARGLSGGSSISSRSGARTA
jgi:hypothetical protein